MSELREHACPKCGMYIWAHPNDKCDLTAIGSQLLYHQRVEENRRYVSDQKAK